MKYKGLVCFDMDNTLVRADKTHVLAFNKAFKKNGLPTVKASVLKKLFGRVGPLIVKELFPGLSKKKIKKIIKDHNNFVIKETSKYAKSFPDVKRTLKILKKKKYELCVLSNCSHKEIIATLKNATLHSLFDIVVGNNDVEHGKPWPDEILKAKRLSHLKAGYMVGDTTYDVIAGKRAKVKTIAVLSGHHTLKMLKNEKPDFIVKKFKGILKCL